MLDRQNIVETHETYAYLICQDALWENMDADRRDIRMKVTIVTMRQDEESEIVLECTETPLKVGESVNERSMSKGMSG